MTVPISKLNRNTSVATAAISPELPEQPTLLSELPGLGPIRLRALQKAGFNTLFKLQAATPSELDKVPGITPVKAEYIRSMLAPFHFTDVEENSPSFSTSEKPEAAATPLSPMQPERPLPIGELLVLMQSTSRLLCRHDRSEMRGRLQRQMEKLIPLPAELQMMWPNLSIEDTEEWPRRILKLVKFLDKLQKERKLSRQQQGDLADAIITATQGSKDNNAFDDVED